MLRFSVASLADDCVSNRVERVRESDIVEVFRFLSHWQLWAVLRISFAWLGKILWVLENFLWRSIVGAGVVLVLCFLVGEIKECFDALF